MEREDVLKALNEIFANVLKEKYLQLDESMSADDVDGGTRSPT